MAIGLCALFAACHSITPPQVTPGVSMLTFDHDGVDTNSYELCWEQACQSIVAIRDGNPGEFHFTLPLKVPEGRQVLRILAIGPGGNTPSAPLTVEVLAP